MDCRKLRTKWRFRYSIRACVALHMAVCVYLACWQITKANGVTSVAKATGRTGRSPAPFVVEVDVSNNVEVTRSYYSWLFGQIMRLPIQCKYPEPTPVVIGGVQPIIIVELDEEEDHLGIVDW